MWPVWQGMTCLPTEKGASSTCSLGGYPVYAVNATSVAQIQAAVNFARNKALRLVVKNTGHDYMGKSVGAGALSIWTHHLTQIEYIPEYTSSDFRGKAAVAGAGVRTFDIAKIAHENGASLVGGQCATVGFAAVQIVTPDGVHRTVNAESHPDLFWAIRGGGASTWGVVTSVTVRLHPRHPLTSCWISFHTSAEVSKETFWKGVRAYAENFEHFADAGFYGFTNIRRNHAGYNGSDFSLGIEPMLAPNMSMESFDEVTRPFFDQLAALGIPFQAERRYFDSFHEGWAEIWPSEILVVAEPLDTPGSRLFPREVWTDPEGLTAILDTFRNISELGYDVTGFLIAPQNPFNVDNAVSPALRHALGYFSTSVEFPGNATSEHKAAAQEELMRNILDPWREVAPSSKFGGSYLNEANPMEPFWQDDLYGGNYPRLLEIKRKYDPNSLFYAVTGVGSEEWEVRSTEQGFRTQNGRLCRV
ncbi:6-hydroxy-D-nicotine oxidase [Escovopsis weberi]|uniref:6-hydroxy-D-nicotine oxidase n=1 Tax=Escovopsis weberi TaxID=150374 RepID=A0A0M9VXD9_ESCWE|nr:6-hydroxy-D-nicotine oxidase [Escovopsis weberi]